MLLYDLIKKNIIKILLGLHIFCTIGKIQKIDDLVLNKLDGVGTHHHCGELIHFWTYSCRRRCSDRDQNNIIEARRVSFTINTILEGNIETRKNIFIPIYHFGNIGSIQILNILVFKLRGEQYQ